ncbi:MAG: serine/threonine protein kinase [Planctomycetes bacterium]|nr:serine/threonine protein kinase [Planctomycetota bacterium]
MTEPTPAELAVDRYVDRLMRGDAPPLDAWLAEHPELGPADRARVEKLARVLGGGRGRPAQPGALPFERLGGYRLVERLGAGGMGIVYRAVDERLDREVALKVLRPELASTPDAEARFEREARAIAKLAHENIVTVFEAGRADSVAFLAMELVRGRSLDELFADAGRAHRRIPVDDLVRWTRDIARALAAAHAVGIVHRDVKPSNVRITPEGRALLLDFGLALDADSQSLSRTGEMRGTLYYVSPEQVSGEKSKVDARTDVWSLGVTLYEGLAGRVPFEGEHSQAVLYRILSAEPVAPRALVPGLSRDLETVVLTAMEKERDRRYPSALAFAEDLDALLSHRPVRARPTGAITRAWKWSRRKPGHAAAIGLATLIAVGGPIAYGVIQAANADALRVEKDAATRERDRAAARTRDLEEMARFQGEVLGAVAPRSMAEHVLERLRAELAALERDPAAAKARTEEFDLLVADVNATNVAVDTLRDDVIAPMIAATKERFADRPHVKGMVLHTIGATCWSLGLAELALDTQRTAYDTLAAALPEEDHDRLGAEANLGLYLFSTGAVAEAEPHLRRAADGLARALGPDDEGALGARHNLAMLLRSLGRMDEAERVLRDVLAARRRTLGDDAPDTLSSLSNLGALLLLQRRGAEAEPLMREAYERRRRVLGPAADTTLTTANNLGILQKSLGALAEAERTLSTAHADARLHLGDRHGVTTSLGVAHADVLIAAGCRDEALELLADATRSAIEAGGPVGREALYALYRYTALLRDLHRRAEAEGELEACWLALDTSIGTDARDARSVVREFAELLDEEGRHVDAAEAWRVLARATAMEAGPAHERAQRYAADLVRSLTHARRFAEAEAELDAARARLGSDAAPAPALVEAALELYERWDAGAADGPHAERAAAWRAFPSKGAAR